ncbi:MAG: uroporphyrinogen decarboxylase [Dehalococcoidia bacterium]|nr:uroporphyrinogen decarboxylase [Dehalococcoidia bacterium]MDW8120286.1 uroporphyrinogen decarboxylase family protein [Chloroflexota bacterium]
MPDQMTPRERVLAALAGQPVDRPPVSMWRHFFLEESDPSRMAQAMLAFQQAYRWDFVKVNPRAAYHGEDWGVRLRYQSDPFAQPEVVDWPVKTPQDWLALKPLDVQQGVLGQHLEALKTVIRGVGPQVPVLMTVFTPLAIAGRLANSDEVVAAHLRLYPEKVSYALDVITDTFIRFARACLEAGAGGLFFATTGWATALRLSRDEYARWGRPYDLRLLQSLPPAPFHLLHVCRDYNYLAEFRDYPVHAVNWDAHGAGNPSLAQGKALLGKCVVGGIPHRTLLMQGTPQQVAEAVHSLRGELGATGWMLGPGCTFPPQAPEANLRALREAIAA